MEEIMKTAYERAANLALAHEIARDPNFVIKPRSPVPNSLEAKVTEIVHKAFWDVLNEQLSRQPPCFDQALNLITEIKERLSGLILPHQGRLRQRIDDVLDVELIGQQLREAGNVEPLANYASFVIDLMSRLCAPVRDADVEKLRSIQEPILAFRGIMEVIDLMTIDFANFIIKQTRPIVQTGIVEYEKNKIQQLESVKKALEPEVDVWKHTRAWLRRSYLRSKSSGATKPAFSEILSKAYMELLTRTDEDFEYPESLALDADRFEELRRRIACSIVTASVVLTAISVVSHLSPSLNPHSALKEKIREDTIGVLERLQDFNEKDLWSSLAEVGKIVICILKESFGDKLSPDLERSLYAQICEIASVQHPVRKLLASRFEEFMEMAVRRTKNEPGTQIPPGLSVLESDLRTFSADFLQLISHNKATFAELYESIIQELLSSDDTAK